MLKRAWPGMIEILYLLFTVCWNTFRAFETSTADFLLIPLSLKKVKGWQSRKAAEYSYISKD